MVAPAIIATVAKAAPKVLSAVKTAAPKIAQTAKKVAADPKVKEFAGKAVNKAKDIAKDPKVKEFANNAFTELSKNPTQGSLFDAFNKLGINNMDDLKAGIDMLKEDPKATLKSFNDELMEKKFVPNFNSGFGGIA